jgi:hypothetical protein
MGAEVHIDKSTPGQVTYRIKCQHGVSVREATAAAAELSGDGYQIRQAIKAHDKANECDDGSRVAKNWATTRGEAEVQVGPTMGDVRRKINALPRLDKADSIEIVTRVGGQTRRTDATWLRELQDDAG